MEDNLEELNKAKEEEYRGVALGICFGSGIGIFMGAVLGYVGMGLSLGAVVGVLFGAYYDSIRKKKNSKDSV